jgi:hypothetical protein
MGDRPDDLAEAADRKHCADQGGASRTPIAGSFPVTQVTLNGESEM